MVSRRREGGEKEGSFSSVRKRRFFFFLGEEEDDDESRLEGGKLREAAAAGVLFSEGDEDAVDNREDWERVTRRPIIIPVASPGSAVPLTWTFCVCVCVCVMAGDDTLPAGLWTVSTFVLVTW